MNYKELRALNQFGLNLPINDRTYRNASMSVNNEQLYEIAENAKLPGFHAR